MTDVALDPDTWPSAAEGLDVELHATRAESDPRRFVGVRIHFAVRGAVDPAQLDVRSPSRRNKHCSVWHSLRQDITLETTTSITA